MVNRQVKRVKGYSISNLIEADLTGAILYNIDLSSANLWGANLRGADLYNTNFSGAILYNVDLEGSESLAYARYNRTIIDEANYKIMEEEFAKRGMILDRETQDLFDIIIPSEKSRLEQEELDTRIKQIRSKKINDLTY